MRRSVLLAAVTLGVGALLSSTAAMAQEGDERGRFHFQAGASYYEAGDYEEALREFKRAYEISKRPELFYNISLAHQQLDDLEEAVHYLNRYLQEVENVPNRVNLERRLENLKERMATQQEPEPEPDQEPPEQGEPEATEGGPAETQPGEGTGTGEPNDWGKKPPADMGTEQGGVPAGAWVGWGIGAAGLATFGVAGIMALRTQSDAEAANCSATRNCDDLADEMDRRALVADIGLGVGIAGAALGTILFFVLRDDGTEETPPATAGMEVAPWVDPNGGGGAVVGGRF